MVGACRQPSLHAQKQNPGPLSARGVTCPATDLIISTRRLEVKVTWESDCPQTPRQLPYQSQGTLWTRRDSNPHLVAGQANVHPLHHGPQRSLREPDLTNKVARHISRQIRCVRVLIRYSVRDSGRPDAIGSDETLIPSITYIRPMRHSTAKPQFCAFRWVMRVRAALSSIG